MDAPLTLTVEEAAGLLGIGRTMAYSLARSGDLPGVVKLGHRFVVARSVLLAAIGETERPPAKAEGRPGPHIVPGKEQPHETARVKGP